jgi:hypothetical protein
MPCLPLPEILPSKSSEDNSNEKFKKVLFLKNHFSSRNSRISIYTK